METKLPPVIVKGLDRLNKWNSFVVVLNKNTLEKAFKSTFLVCFLFCEEDRRRMDYLLMSLDSGRDKAKFHKNLLSEDKYCLTEADYQQQLHLHCCDCCPSHLLLSKHICQVVFSATQLYEIGPKS